MDYEQIAPAFEDQRVDNIIREDGRVDLLPKLTTKLPPKEIIKAFNMRIEDSLDYWNDIQGYNLKYARAQSERMVIGKQIDISKLYRYQIPYIDNEIHIAVDAIIAYVSASSPRAEVWPAQGIDKSKILARDLEKGLQAHSDKFSLNRLFEIAIYNVLINRIGFLKLYYDPDYGQNGEIIPCALNADWVIVDKNVRLGQEPEWICELHKDTVERLIYMYPDKKEEIFKQEGIKKGTKRQMSSEVVWREVHATIYNKWGKEPQEMVFCYMKNIMLDQYKDTNWIYNGDNGSIKNFLDQPKKPYIPLNYLNDGTHWIDQTTPVEQAYSMQDVLNKRGRQIMENADTANGFLVISDEGTTADDAENLTGDPNEKIVLKTNGRPIGDYIMQIEPHMLPDYVIEDKADLRQTLHSLTGTPAQFSGTNQGENKNDKTLGEALMIKNQATGRQDRLVRCVEQCAKQYFNFLAQMMKVHYTDKHWFTYNGSDGDFDHIAITRNSIEEGMQVEVRSGTTLPFDKSRAQSIALNLAKMGLISPLDLYKDLDMDRPQERYDNWVKWKTDPMQLVRDLENQEEDEHAYMEFIEIMGGGNPKPYDEVDVGHILTHRKQMISDEFLKATRSKQSKMLRLVETELRSLELRNALDQMSSPPPQPGQSPQPGQPLQPGQPPQAPPQPAPPGGGMMLPGMGVPSAPPGPSSMMPPPGGVMPGPPNVAAAPPGPLPPTLGSLAPRVQPPLPQNPMQAQII